MIEDLAHELFPMFQLQEGEGIEDAINRVVPVLEDAQEYQAKKLDDMASEITELRLSLNQRNREVGELQDRIKALEEVLDCAFEWIDAVPGNTVLPSMPGFDRDWADNVMKGINP